MLSARTMLPRCAATPTYQCRQPEQTALYRTVQAHLETFLAQTAGDAEGAGGGPRATRPWTEALTIPARTGEISLRGSGGALSSAAIERHRVRGVSVAPPAPVQ